MNTNLNDKSTNSLMSLLDSGAGRIKIVIIFVFIIQLIALVPALVNLSIASVLLSLGIIFVVSILWQQIKFLKQFQQTNDVADFENALKQESLFWIIIGCLTILSIIAFIYSILSR